MHDKRRLLRDQLAEIDEEIAKLSAKRADARAQDYMMQMLLGLYANVGVMPSLADSYEPCLLHLQYKRQEKMAQIKSLEKEHDCTPGD